MANAPLSPVCFAALMKACGDVGARVGVAVSGGPDSVALAFCLHRMLGTGNVKALIVEHGLRTESADEAADVAARLRSMGIETEILPWAHEAITSRVHVRARTARYGLLLEACKRLGLASLCFAHHADDQAETILMRFAKGSGIDGLAGMEAVTQLDGVSLVRPLLSVPKASLIATCEANNLAYVIDPSNEGEKYARGRLRRILPFLEREGLSAARLVDLGDRAREAKEALDFSTRSALKLHAQILTGGAVRLDLQGLRGAPRAIALRTLVQVLASVHPTAYPPERKHMVPLVTWLLDPDEHGARTLHGCLIQKGEICDKATVLREAAAIADVQTIALQQTVLWDGVWRVTYGGSETGLKVRALGRQTHEVVDHLAPRLRALVPQGRVRASLPALWRGTDLVALPSFSQTDQGVAVAERQAFDWE